MKKKNNIPSIFNVVFYDGNFLELTFDPLGTRKKIPEENDVVLERMMMMVQSKGNGVSELVALFLRDRGYDHYAVSTFLKNALPEYMFPTSLMTVDQFPTIPAKVNRTSDFNGSKIFNTGHSNSTSLQVIQQYLLEIWQSTLQVDHISVDDDFFDFGGNSLLAGILTFRINTCLGIAMPLKWISETSTVSALADRIYKAHTHIGVLDARTNDMEVQKNVKVAHLKFSSTLQPFFFCPPLEGLQSTTSINGAMNMASLLGDILSFYCIHPPALQPELLARLKNNDDIDMKVLYWNEMLFENVIEEAVANIINIQETGPYWLGGYCTGCMLATAIGDLLIKKGKEVKRMILLDAPLWGEEDNTTDDWVEYNRNDIIWFVSYDIGKDIPGMDWTSVCELVENVSDELIWQTMLDFIFEKKALPVTTTLKNLKSAFELKFFNYPAVHYYLGLVNYRYPVTKVDSSLLLYTTSTYNNLPDDFGQYVKTNVLLGNVCVKKIPVSHLGLFQPNDLISWIDVVRETLQE